MRAIATHDGQTSAHARARAALFHDGLPIAQEFGRRVRADRALRAQLAVKRAVDVVASTLLLVALAPLLLATAGAVRATSSGPALYAGKRWGHRGRLFPCFKFRSMVVDQTAALARKGLSDRGTEGRLLLHDDDPRVTPAGRFLRKCSIDELPQLINVLRGEMSLVGPRPLAPYMLQGFEEFGIARSVVRPGITGLWQISKRTKNASILDMIAEDMTYVRSYSLLLDLRIVLATIPRVLEPSRSSGNP